MIINGKSIGKPPRIRDRRWLEATWKGGALLLTPTILSIVAALVIVSFYHPPCVPKVGGMCLAGKDVMALGGLTAGVVAAIWLIAIPLTAWLLRMRWPMIYLLPLLLGFSLRMDILLAWSVQVVLVWNLVTTAILMILLAVFVNVALRKDSQIENQGSTQ